jgi:catechol 2,3-dioxygenase-like lactoylglutathione lyase family enzyme
MSALLRLPSPVFRPEEGLLRNEHFQIAYVTTDIARASAIFGDRFGIREFRHVEGATPFGGYMKVGLAWVGATMYELIEASGSGTEFYTRRLPQRDFGMHFHHLAYLVRDQAGWDAVEAQQTKHGWPMVINQSTEGFMRYCYIEVPELGHYLEYILPEPAGIEFFESIPSN